MENLLKEFGKFPLPQYEHIVLSEQEKKSALYHYIKNNFNSVPDGFELYDEEKIEAYRLARKKKDTEIKSVEYWKKVYNEPIKLNPTAEDLYEKFIQHLIRKRGGVDLNDGRKDIYISLSRYFTNDKRFDGDLSRSLLIMGTIGVGKTEMMQFFQRNQNRSYNMVRCRTISYEYKTNGVPAIETYSNNQGDVGYCFDDLGTETAVGNYGDKLNVMSEVLLNRMDDGYKPSHITCNLKIEQIKDGYGIRLHDRMKENYNQITFPLTAKSLRK